MQENKKAKHEMGNEEIKTLSPKIAANKLNRISEDAKMQRIAELREKAIQDEKATYKKGIRDRNARRQKRGNIKNV